MRAQPGLSAPVYPPVWIWTAGARACLQHMLHVSLIRTVGLLCFFHITGLVLMNKRDSMKKTVPEMSACLGWCVYVCWWGVATLGSICTTVSDINVHTLQDKGCCRMENVCLFFSRENRVD